MTSTENGYLTDNVRVSDDPMLVRYTDFDPACMYLEPPKDGKSKKDPSVGYTACYIRYTYTKKDGSKIAGPLKIEGPKGWSREGIKVGTDQITKERNGTYSYGHEVSGASVEGKKMLSVLDMIYRRLCAWYLENKALFPRAGETIPVASEAPPIITNDFKVFAWPGCKYIYKVPMIPGKDEVIDDAQVTIWGGIMPSGNRPVKFYDIEKVTEADGSLKLDDNGKPITIKNLISPKVYMNSAIEGYPTWCFNDWYISSGHRKIRFYVATVLMTDVDIKGVVFEQETTAQEEAIRRHKLESDPIKAMMQNIMKLNNKTELPISQNQIPNTAYIPTNTVEGTVDFSSPSPSPFPANAVINTQPAVVNFEAFQSATYQLPAAVAPVPQQAQNYQPTTQQFQSAQQQFPQGQQFQQPAQQQFPQGQQFQSAQQQFAQPPSTPQQFQPGFPAATTTAVAPAQNPFGNSVPAWSPNNQGNGADGLNAILNSSNNLPNAGLAI